MFKNILAGAMIIVSGTMMAQHAQMPPVPVDEAVRIGKLPNGLTYYVRHNNYPEHQANFYIAQRVGSIQEEESQRGLAHFLEHMCFNGTQHYPKDGLIRYLETLGVQFGSNLNAYTSIDQTVYRICNVPTTRISALDSCLLIIKDWASALTLDPKEIDQERGVIHEEWRMRTSANSRMLERNLPSLYPGSKYGLRYPIGLMSVVDNFKPKELVDYYHKWYHPSNQAVIVVGDVDVDRTEAKIKEMFGTLVEPKNAPKVIAEPVPDNNEPIVIVDKDKEQQYSTVQLMYKREAIPDSAKSSMMYLIKGYIDYAIGYMLNNRYAELGQKADCPFIQASGYNDNYILSKTKDAFKVSCLPKEGKVVEALAAAFREAMRAREYGFTATEYARAKAEYLSSLEKEYINRNKRDNSVFGDMYRDNFLGNEPIPSTEYEYKTMSQIVPMIPIGAVNTAMKKYVAMTDSNLVIINFNQEKDGAVYPTADGLKKAIADVRSEKLTAYVDNVKTEPLIAKLPAKGSIKSEKENKVLGFKELVLSNGAKVILKKTDFKDDQVLMSAWSKGGASLLGKKDYVNARLFDSVIETCGLGNFNSTELDKALAGKQANVNLKLGTYTEGAAGRSTPKDLTTMLQMTYLYFTNINKDTAAYESMMKQLELSLKNKNLNPNYVFSDSVSVTTYSHSPRFAPLNVDLLKQANYDRILQIAKERYADASDFTFLFVGSFEEDSIKPLVEQYIASLPAKGVKEKSVDVHCYSTGKVINQFNRAMQTPKAIARMEWSTDKVKLNVDNYVMADAAGQLLDMIYLKKIREDASAAYSAQATGEVYASGDKVYATLLGYCPMKPEKSDLALKIMRDEVKMLGEKVDASMLDKVKEYMLKTADENAKKNEHWLGVLSSYTKYGVDFETEYKNAVKRLTPQSISSFVKNVILSSGNDTEVIMLPAADKK